jgi:hypothetical protein
MSYCKFYINRFENKNYSKPDDKKFIIKFGITRHSDALKRFDDSINDGYVKDYSDWNIKVLYSQNFFGPNARTHAEEMERYFLHEVFPPSTHKVWIEDYLQIKDKRKYDNSGITEIRLLTQKEINKTITNLKSNLTEEELNEKAKKRDWMVCYYSLKT